MAVKGLDDMNPPFGSRRMEYLPETDGLRGGALPISFSHDEPRSPAMPVSALMERNVEFVKRPISRSMYRRGSTRSDLTTRVYHGRGGRKSVAKKRRGKAKSKAVKVLGSRR